MKKIILLSTIGLVCLTLFPAESFFKNQRLMIKKEQQPDAASLSMTWGDSLFFYAIESYLPPSYYRWNWRDAVILRAVAEISRDNKSKREIGLKYIKECVANTIEKAHSRHPNAAATAFALPLLYKQTGKQEYMDKALEMYEQYMQIPRARNGGVSHKYDPQAIELWDDTVYMIGLFLLEMHRVTGDEKYLQEFIFQIIAHHEKLCDPKTGLWYHGWDNDNISTPDNCSQDGWGNNPKRRNNEFWGRGNGWIAMSLANCLEAMQQNDTNYTVLKNMFTKMMKTLLLLQNEKNGHWLQLPIHVEDIHMGNYIESSCTVMFGYAIAKGISLGVLPKEKFYLALVKAYQGIGKYSIIPLGEYRTIQNVCEGTCIGDKQYYYKREIVKGTEFGIGGALLFYNLCQQRIMNN